MKTLILSAFVFLHCAVGTAGGQTFHLSVTTGFGTGTYNEGDTVHVWSKALSPDAVFVSWTGSGTDYMLHTDEWHSILTVPVGEGVESIMITANHDVIPPATLIDSTSYLLLGLDDGNLVNVERKTYYAMPLSPKGLVFLFHGTGGHAKSFFQRYENYSMVKDLVYDGFAVLALDANEIIMGDQNGNEKLQWNVAKAGIADENNNVDINNVKSLKDSVLADFSLPSDLPCFSVGMSNGAIFSDLCASALSFNASAHYTTKSVSAIYTRPDIAPVIWIMAENDNHELADNAAGFDNYLTMSATQVAEWHWFRRSPAYSRRFMRSLNNVTEAQSDSVFERLQDGGFLTADSMLTYASLDSIPISILSSLGLTSAQVFDIAQQLRCINADHVFHSDFNKNVIRFFNQTFSPVSVQSNDIQNRNRPTASVYPNPFINRTTIEFNHNRSKTNMLKLFNILGQEVRTIPNIASGRIEIRRENLTSGLYFYQLWSDRRIIASGRLTIQ